MVLIIRMESTRRRGNNLEDYNRREKLLNSLHSIKFVLGQFNEKLTYGKEIFLISL